MKYAKYGMVLALSLAMMVSLPGLSEAAEESEESEAAVSDCDRYMEAYVRSSARKIIRALSRDGYRFEATDLDDTLRVSADELGTSEAVEFEVVRDEESGMVGLVDRRREWEQTYLVAQSAIGPIVVSQSWQPRHLRDAGQECRPFSTSVESPSLTASTVAPEPFEYWGLRVGWRIPSPDGAESGEESLSEVLVDIMRAHAGAD